MLFTTPTQYIVLGIVLIVGWLFGLASHPGGRKWKRAYQDERDLHARNRALADAKARDDRVRIAELEATHAELRRNQDLVATPAGPVARAAAAPALVAVPTAAPSSSSRRGWFSWGRRDELSRVRGIDTALAVRLNDQGVSRFQDIVDLSHEDEMALEQRLSLPAGTIQRDQWREQAALLVAAKDGEHGERFARVR